MSTGDVSSVGATTSTDITTENDLANALDADVFLELLLTEMENQDPMEPMSNSELVQQLSQIWELQSNMELSGTLESLTSSLESVTLAQNLASANSLIGRLAVGETEEAGEIAGWVNGVTIEDGQVKVYLGENTCNLEDVTEILDAAVVDETTESEDETDTAADADGQTGQA
jgi:flagellar basal-body rod modification protein FlgD